MRLGGRPFFRRGAAVVAAVYFYTNVAAAHAAEASFWAQRRAATQARSAAALARARIDMDPLRQAQRTRALYAELLAERELAAAGMRR